MCSVRNQHLRSRYAAFYQRVDLFDQEGNVQSHTVSQHAGGVFIKHAGRQHVQSEFSIVVFDSMACVASSLKSDDNVRPLSQCVCDFAFSFVAPIGAYDCFDHFVTSYSLTYRKYSVRQKISYTLISAMRPSWSSLAARIGFMTPLRNSVVCSIDLPT